MKEQREKEIMRVLNEKSQATVAQLAALLGVSTSTIRRDLAELAKKDMVAVKRDGVVPLAEEKFDTPMDYRVRVNAQSKRILAKDAVKLVADGMTLFLDSSTTVLPMVRPLRAFKNMIVVTNSLPVIRQLQGCGYPTHLIGGEMSIRSRAFYGQAAERAVRGFNFDMAFMSPVAITPDNFVAETIEDAATIRRAAIERSRCSVLLCDHTKIGQIRPYNIAHLDEFDFLITDDTSHAFITTATVRRVKD